MKLSVIIFSVFLTMSLSGQSYHHSLQVNLYPQSSRVEVKDKITLLHKPAKGQQRLDFYLNKNLKITASSVDYKEAEEQGVGLQRHYLIYLEAMKGREIELRYAGVINDRPEQGTKEYARGFSETTGIISDRGVFLSGTSQWVPNFNDALFSFDMTVHLPGDWNVVSQGSRKLNELEDKGKRRRVSYRFDHPTEEVYLVAARWTEYEQDFEGRKLQAFLRKPDKELADRYLKMTGRYMKMYEDMLGPYPYSKFALVENFWETGYGMPSFTLLGEKIIRFPFILYSSYPHELLHNYWGNSVYVDYDRGNWCEGITAYMADHLLKEQRGQGAAYRRNTLQKFSDFVNSDNDFPLSDFLNRNNSAEEAIGYGKCLMMNHMLRKDVGDELFLKAYRKFYDDNKFKRASWDDIRAAFEAVTGRSYEAFFNQWVHTKGSPHLKLSDVRSLAAPGDTYDVYFTLSQEQEGELFSINVPVALYFADTVIVQDFRLDRAVQQFHYLADREPLRLEVDPQFDVFRTLEASEVPPTLSQVFGEREGLIILPSESKLLTEYTKLATTWQASAGEQGNRLKIVMDKELEQLPEGRKVWVLGYENRFYSLLKKVDVKSIASEEVLRKADEMRKEGSWVMVVRHPGNEGGVMGFVGTTVPEALPGLTRLLPHYGKYSYLAFKGTRPENILKGNFKVSNSPLFYTFAHTRHRLSPAVRLQPAAPLHP